MFVGKWKYCSPEHLGMLPPGERIDGRADLYSFGIVLYEMLTGVPPFQADTPHAYLMLHSQTRPRAIREANPLAASSPELEALVFRALEKDRAQRFATAREFAHAIDAIAPRLSDTAGAAPPLPPTAEVTNEATRVADRVREAHDAATVVSIAQDALTVAMTPVAMKKPATKKTLDRSGAERAGNDAPQSRRSPMLAIAAVLAIVLGIGGWMAMRNRSLNDAQAPVTQTVTQASTVSLPSQEPVSSQPGYLGINAFPWANVTSIRNLDNGQDVAIESSLVTPTPPVDLAPGRYEVTLMNPQFTKPITRTVAIAPGAEETLNVTFRDPASATVPDFGVTR
jgi:serine/threonine protein kinase